LLGIEVAGADPVGIRSAGRDVLSLALIDARNHTLRWIAAFEALLGPALALPEGAALASPRWILGHVGWYAEHWIARNVQRGRGTRSDRTHPKLASILPGADGWFEPSARERVPAPDLPDLQTLRQYLVDTLESTLELLEHADGDDDALYFYRAVLLHEEMQRERLAMLAQEGGLPVALDELAPAAQAAAVAPRAPLLFPAMRWRYGSDAGRGFAFDVERPAQDVALPEFEIDAQPVSWSQYVEFVEDGGYDEPRHWSEAGWAWAQREGRRTPRHVDQMRQGVLLQRFGKLVRAPLGQAATHLSWYEADAWCRWAGRRLPAEVEWEAAALLGANRGLRWGGVLEWTASRFVLPPGYAADPDPALANATLGGAPPDRTAPDAPKALRGASFATAARLRHPKRRSWMSGNADSGFFGFRSCAL